MTKIKCPCCGQMIDVEKAKALEQASAPTVRKDSNIEFGIGGVENA